MYQIELDKESIWNVVDAFHPLSSLYSFKSSESEEKRNDWKKTIEWFKKSFFNAILFLHMG